MERTCYWYSLAKVNELLQSDNQGTTVGSYKLFIEAKNARRGAVLC